MQTVFRLFLRLVFVVAGLVFAAALAVAVVILLALWGARSLWARLTGRPVTPFVMRIDPRGGFGRVYQPRRWDADSPVAPDAVGTGRRQIADVTDVEAKEPRS